MLVLSQYFGYIMCENNGIALVQISCSISWETDDLDFPPLPSLIIPILYINYLRLSRRRRRRVNYLLVWLFLRRYTTANGEWQSVATARPRVRHTHWGIGIQQILGTTFKQSLFTAYHLFSFSLQKYAVQRNLSLTLMSLKTANLSLLSYCVCVLPLFWYGSSMCVCTCMTPISPNTLTIRIRAHGKERADRATNPRPLDIFLSAYEHARLAIRPYQNNAWLIREAAAKNCQQVFMLVQYLFSPIAVT